ncbi:MAG: glycosyltransferase [Bacteroidetes bacterium]|nr:glycosyltransferase [Bacteroidota bacterium]
MPKVLRIVNRFNLGGPTYNAAYLTKYLSPEFETLLIGGMKDDSEESSEFILKNLELEYQIIPEMKRSINPFNDFSAYNKIKKIIRYFKPDIVHTHAAKAGALGRKAAFACNVPITVHTFHGHVFHSYFGSLKTSVYKTIERNLAKKTNAIIAISQKQKSELVEEHKIVSEEKVHVIPLGFDLQRFNDNSVSKRKLFREKYNLSEDVISIGIVGRLVPVKNHMLFLEAVKFVEENSKQKIKAFIIGDGEERQKLKSTVNELRLNEIVVFTSWEKEVHKIYPGLDIVCLTSFNEGTPVSLIEAQAANKAIVTTNAGGIEDAVIPNKTALISEVADKRNFYNNLLEMVENDSMRHEFGKNGWLFVKEKFGLLRLTTEVKNLYHTLLK